MPVEIRKLIIKGVVHETDSPRKSGPTSYDHRPSKIEIQKEELKLVKLKKEILRECKDMMNELIDRKSNRY